MTLSEAYKVIGAKESDTIEVIKRKYRKLARENHPDISGKSDAEEITKRINVAYDIIIKTRKESQTDNAQYSKENTKETNEANQKENTSNTEYHYSYNKNKKSNQAEYDYAEESIKLYQMYTDEKYVGATDKNKEFIDWLNDNKRIEFIAEKLNTTRTKLYADYAIYTYNSSPSNSKITFIEYVELVLMCYNMNKTIQQLEKEHQEELIGHITDKENFLEYILEKKQIKEISNYINIKEESLKLNYLYQRVIGKINYTFTEYIKEQYQEYINNKTKYNKK